MKQEARIFEEFFFNELYQATERALEKLAEEKGWKVENYNEGKTRSWVVQAVPEFSIFKFHLLPNGAYKKLKVRVSGQEVIAECRDNWPRLTFDFLNQKGKIITVFFNQLEEVIREDFGQ